VSKSSNHAKAPICAAFVEEMRAVFGEVRVIYVKENDFQLGEPDAADDAKAA
jgi:hypothetical protein